MVCYNKETFIRKEIVNVDVWNASLAVHPLSGRQFFHCGLYFFLALPFDAGWEKICHLEGEFPVKYSKSTERSSRL